MIHGRVLDPDGEPVGGDEILLSSLDEADIFCGDPNPATDQQGRFRIPVPLDDEPKLEVRSNYARN